MIAEARPAMRAVQGPDRPSGFCVDGVKVLDFGLAKALNPTTSSSLNATMSPTLSIHATQAGIILGTAAYMSPEQARGRVVDKRAQDVDSLVLDLNNPVAQVRMAAKNSSSRRPALRQPLRHADGRTAWCTPRKAQTDWWQAILLLLASFDRRWSVWRGPPVNMDTRETHCGNERTMDFIASKRSHRGESHAGARRRTGVSERRCAPARIGGRARVDRRTIRRGTAADRSRQEKRLSAVRRGQRAAAVGHHLLGRA